MTEKVSEKVKMLKSEEFGVLGKQMYQTLVSVISKNEVMLRDVAYSKYLLRNPEVVRNFNAGLINLADVIGIVSEGCKSLITWVPVRVTQTRKQIGEKIYTIPHSKKTLIKEITNKFNCVKEDLHKLDAAIKYSSNGATILLYCGKVDNNDAVLVCIID